MFRHDYDLWELQSGLWYTCILVLLYLSIYAKDGREVVFNHWADWFSSSRHTVCCAQYYTKHSGQFYLKDWNPSASNVLQASGALNLHVSNADMDKDYPSLFALTNHMSSCNCFKLNWERRQGLRLAVPALHETLSSPVRPLLGVKSQPISLCWQREPSDKVQMAAFEANKISN